MRYPLNTLHTLIVLSSDPEAKYSPHNENTTHKIESECPMSVLIRFPLDTLNTPIV